MNIKTAEFVTGVAKTAQLPRAVCPEVAWAGRSNVGKSSLINRLVNRKNLARTSNTPGKTRQINFFLINNAWHLVDLPGYGFARGPEAEREGWRDLIEAYLKDRHQLAGLAVLVDSRTGPTKLDAMMFDWLASMELPWSIVLTKTDKLSGNELAKAERDAAKQIPTGIQLLPCSAKTGRGIDVVRGWMDERIRNHTARAGEKLEWQIAPQGDE